MCHVANQRMFKVWLMNDLIFKLSNYAKIQENALRILHQTTDNVIKKKLEQPRSKILGAMNGEENEGESVACRLTVLNLLLYV